MIERTIVRGNRIRVRSGAKRRLAGSPDEYLASNCELDCCDCGSCSPVYC